MSRARCRINNEKLWIGGRLWITEFIRPKGKKVLLGNRATVNGRDAIAYVKNGRLQSYAYMDDFASQFYSGPRMNFTDSSEGKRI